MKRVYIAHPLRGSIDENIKSVTEICQRLASSVIPISPIHSFSFLDPNLEAEKAMKYCFALLELADELWVYGNYRQSEGCLAEIAFAGCRNIPIRFKTGEK